MTEKPHDGMLFHTFLFLAKLDRDFDHHLFREHHDTVWRSSDDLQSHPNRKRLHINFCNQKGRPSSDFHPARRYFFRRRGAFTIQIGNSFDVEPSKVLRSLKNSPISQLLLFEIVQIIAFEQMIRLQDPPYHSIFLSLLGRASRLYLHYAQILELVS